MPESLINHLQKSFESVEVDSSVEGFNRNQELREKGVVSYQQLKRIKNWFDTYSGDKKDAPFILNGGDRMNGWCDHVLNHWRSSLTRGKEVKMNSGMQNQFIDSHEKDEVVVNPQKKHSSGIEKYDTAVTENIKKINNLMKH